MAKNDLKLFHEAYEAITKEAAPKKKTFDTAEKAFIIASLKKLAEDIDTKS